MDNEGGVLWMVNATLVGNTAVAGGAIRGRRGDGDRQRDDHRQHSGGSAKYAKAKGAWVKLTATGRAFTLVTTKGPGRGKAKVYVDGRYATTIDLKAATTQYRVQAWSKTFASTGKHTIKLVLLGTSGRPRIDVDAFGVLR